MLVLNLSHNRCLSDWEVLGWATAQWGQGVQVGMCC